MGSAQSRHVLRAKGGLANILFDPPDIARLVSSHQLLNDVCINRGAAVLHDLFSSSYGPGADNSQRCAILSTFDLPRVRFKCSDDELWHHIYHTSYWAKDVWILPIHRPSPAAHWVLCVISLRSRELFLFDSMVGRRAWRHEIKVSPSFDTRLYLLITPFRIS